MNWIVHNGVKKPPPLERVKVRVQGSIFLEQPHAAILFSKKLLHFVNISYMDEVDLKVSLEKNGLSLIQHWSKSHWLLKYLRSRYSLLKMHKAVYLWFWKTAGAYLQKQPPEIFYKKGVLKDFAKFTGKHLCQSLIKRLLWILRNF